MWIILLVTPTPGGSGVAEVTFKEFLGEFIATGLSLDINTTKFATVAIAFALLWRLISYYPYLIIGAILVPKWVNDKFA